ncbi:unnamed protein product [Dibothriocephalus latus]|uniref:Ubiquitin-like protein ATG12 n=1 Tax=Dibothriocephalus latus TaxID=60516 RepID=A0A3P6TEL5_DIBLA|nr:unnamed protein product [Dibothriocephalus latus]
MSTANAKVDVLLKPVGDAPGMQKSKWKVQRTDTLLNMVNFIRRYLKLDPHDNLLLYVSQSFAPSLDTEIGTLYDCFHADGKLILNYCKCQAWG